MYFVDTNFIFHIYDIQKYSKGEISEIYSI